MLLTCIRLPKLLPAWMAIALTALLVQAAPAEPPFDAAKFDAAKFDVVGDGKFRNYKVNLSEVASYKGPMSYLMFRPSLKPEQGGWVKVRQIRLGK